MMSVSIVSAGAAASGYYKEEGYYKADTPEAEKVAQWFGKAAEAAELTGYVDDARFTELLDGQSPDGKLMGRYVDGERKHRPGLDLTFSASKSASIAALVMGDDRITHAHDKAVREAMKIVEERFITTRWQQDGEMHTGPGKGIIAGIFRHDTSRALDPNLHSHAVIANMVLNEKGEYTALRNESVYRNQKLITEIYRSSFEQQLRELGVETQRGQYGQVELTAIPEAVLEFFSSRSGEIDAYLKEKGLHRTPETAEWAALATRAAKHNEVDRDALRIMWRRDALEAGLDERLLDRGRIEPEAPDPGQRPELRAEREIDRRQPQQDPQEVSRISAVLGWMKALVGAPAPQRDQPDPETPVARAVTQAIAHVSERQSVYDRSALTAAALRFSYRGDIEQVDREIDRRIEAGSLYARGEDGQTLTDQASVKIEQSIIKGWRAAERASGPDLSPTRTHPGIPDLDAALAGEPTLPGPARAVPTRPWGTSPP
ncbi:MobF family relaxase, partial [Ruegeria sp. HKCCD8929]|uniref:MobF family relaxase n=1 Tax=Ruegeria sp. HKCCD8929 TaxID=2683006 RepID=UPI001487CE54